MSKYCHGVWLLTYWWFLSWLAEGSSCPAKPSHTQCLRQRRVPSTQVSTASRPQPGTLGVTEKQQDRPCAFRCSLTETVNET